MIMTFILHAYHFMHKSCHHANAHIHSCILVTETLENKPIEPVENVETG